MNLLILRHGETQWTISHQYTGITDLHLTARGRDQARAQRDNLRALLRDQTPRVLVSPRRRAAETARLALPGCKTETEPLLREYEYGAYEGLTPTQIEARAPGWNIWTDGCPSGEATDEVGVRADAVLACIAAETTPVVAVTHGHMSRVLAARALGLDASEGSIFASATASLSQVKQHRGRSEMALWNFVADLTDLGGRQGS